jgi:hypothetical protein
VLAATIKIDMNSEVFPIIWIMLLVAGLMLLGEGLHRIFRAPRMPPRMQAPAPAELSSETFEDRYSIRHLERFLLILFSCFVAFVLLLVRGLDVQFPLLLIGVVGIWWAFRRGALR